MLALTIFLLDLTAPTSRRRSNRSNPSVVNGRYTALDGWETTPRARNLRCMHASNRDPAQVRLGTYTIELTVKPRSGGDAVRILRCELPYIIPKLLPAATRRQTPDSFSPGSLSLSTYPLLSHT